MPAETDDDPLLDQPLLTPRLASLIDTAGWRAAEAAMAADLAELAFDAGRLAERVALAGQGAVQRLALEEAASLSWWTGDRVTSDALAPCGCRTGSAQRGKGATV